MVPKSVLNDLRRQLVGSLLAARQRRHPVSDANALESLRAAIPQHSTLNPQRSSLYALARTLDQVEAASAWVGPVPLGMIYAEFEDVRRYPEAIRLARAAGVPIALATTRIIKPTEEGLLKHLGECQPDAILIRNLAGLTIFRERYPHLPLIGDYALNVSNELTAQLMSENNVQRIVPSYDLSWKQLIALLRRFPASAFEAVVHQHMPMFHTEHCVFCHTLSTGTDYRDCGRPCETHKVDLRDRVGVGNPLLADVGCRNTVYNGQAQSAAEYIPEMLKLGLRHFRVELLRQSGEESKALLTRYARVIAGQDNPRSAWRQLKVLNQLGVTRGTLDE
jgi:putative protease